MSRELIDREEALKAICLYCNDPLSYHQEHGCSEPCTEYCELSRLPVVDAVELPCKIGDTVWCIRNFHGHKHPQEGIVSEMLFTKEMRLQIVVKYVGCGHWGEKIFPTREAAEAAINKKEKENE